MFYSYIVSFILSQVFGVYLLILAIIMLTRVSYFRQCALKLQPDDGVIVFGGAIGLLIGLVLVDIHNIWVLAPRVLVSMLCWIILIKSLLWLIVPESMLRFIQHALSGKGYYWIALGMVLLGSILVTRGFYLFLTHYPKVIG